jgi:hypothetical protein
MPTDYSGSAHAAKLRRIAAAGGPVPAVRPNIGSQALDAQLGRAECCSCNPQVTWAPSPLQLTLSGTYDYSAQYATVISDVAVTPLSGEIIGVTPPGAYIEVFLVPSGNTWTVTFSSDTALTGISSWEGSFQFACNPTRIISKTFTFTV